MNNIENRIVEMKFDNEQFESAVAKTMDTLDKFKEKLNFNNAGKGMDNLGKATGNYQYTLNDIGQSLDQLNSRFSTMGTIGRRVLENLTDSAVNFAKNGLSKMFGDITHGGLSRAMNLEQAKFQMQGIYKDAEKVYDVIYNDILPELQGTPFSLDQAAVVIGQLGASGIQSSKQIRQATRAIAGLAAMSGRGFDEVGRIFSKVAGQGNMMGGELQQLSTYGINAAANISEYFTKVANGEEKASKKVKAHVAEIIDAYGDLSEGTIRDAASKRMVYYEDMAAAMDTLYGEHAKKSTEMYTGALEDLKAALARIGAEPAAVGLEVLKNAFNALVPAVDAVNAVLKPFTNSAKDVVEGADGDKVFGGKMYGTLAKEVQSLGVSFANLFVRMDENGKVLRWNKENISRFATTLKDADGVVHHFAVSGQEIAEGDAIMNPHMWRIITASTQTFVNVMKALRSIIQPIAKGIAGAFPRITLKTISNMAEGLRDFTSHLILSGKNMERLKWIVQGVFTPMGLIFRGLVGLVKAFIKVMGTAFEAIKPALKAAFSFAASLGQVISGFGDFIVELVGTGVAIGKFIGSLIGGIAQFFRLDKVLGLIQTGFTKLADIFDIVGAKLNSSIGNAVPKFKEFISSFGELIHAKEIAGHIKTLFDNIRNSVSKALHLDEVSGAFKTLVDSFKSLGNTDGLLGKVIENLKNFVSFLSELIPYETIVSKISGAFDKLADSIGRFTKKPAGALKKFFQDRAKDVADFIKNLDEGNAFERLARSAIKPYDKIKSLISNVQKILIPLLQTAVSYIPKLFGFVTFGEMMTHVGDKIKSTVKEFAKFIGILGELTKEQTDTRLDQLRKTLTTFFGTNIADNIIKMGKSLSAAGGGFASKLTEFAKSVGETLRNLDEKSIRKFISTLALLALAWKYLGVMRSTKATLEGYATMFKNFGQLLGGFKSAFGLKDINVAIAKSIKMISLAASLVLFAGAVYILSKMDWKQVLIGSGIMLIALLAFYKIMRAIELLEVSIKNSHGVRSLAVYMAGIGAGVILIALAVKEIVQVWKSASPDQALAAVLSILVIMTTFGLLVKSLDGLKGDAKALGKASFALIGIAQGIKTMAEAMKAMGEIKDIKVYAKGLVAVVAIMGMFALFAHAVKVNAKVFSAATGMMAIATAMLIMCKAVASLGSIPKDKIQQGGLALGQILLMITAFAAIASRAEASILAAGIGMIAIGAAIQIIAHAIDAIGNLDQDVFERGSAAIVAILAAFVLFAKFAGGGGSVGAAAAVLMLAAGIHILVNSLQELSAINFFLLLNGLIKMVVVAAGLAVSIAVLNTALKMIGAWDAAKVALLGAGIFLLANALSVLAAIPIVTLAIAIMGLVIALGAIAVVMGLFSGIAPGMLLVAASFALLGVAALFVGAGLLFLTTALTALIPLLLTISMVDTDTLAKGLDVIKTIAVGLSDAFISLAKGVAVFGLACLAAGIGLLSIGAGLVVIGLGATLASLGVALFAGALALLAITIQKFFGGGLLGIISDGFESFTSGFTGLFGRLWEKIVGTSGTKAKETRTAIDQGLADGSGEGEVTDSLEKGPKDALADIMKWGPTGYSEAGADINEALSEGWTGGGNPLDMTDFKKKFDVDLADLGDSSYDGGFDIVEQISTGELDAKYLTDGSTDKLKKSLEKKLGSGDYNGIGYNVPKSVAKGEDSGRSLVNTATGKVEGAAKPSISTGPGSSIYSTGYSVSQGLANGITSGIPLITSAAQRAADAAAKGAKSKKGADVNSPSKKTIPIGMSIGEGLVVGMERMTKAVGNAGTELGNESAESLNRAMQKISMAFDDNIDFNPTISPVVDLTNIRQGASDISSILNDSYSLSTPYSNFYAAQSAAMSFRGVDSDKFDAISKLAKEIGSMNETMNSRQMINNIQIEGSTDPNAFADALTQRFKLKARTI